MARRTAFAAVALTAAALMTVAAPAHAVQEMTLSCSPYTAFKFECKVGAKINLPPFQIRWFLNGQLVIANNDKTTFISACRQTPPTVVRVEVTDALTSASRSTSPKCFSGNL